MSNGVADAAKALISHLGEVRRRIFARWQLTRMRKVFLRFLGLALLEAQSRSKTRENLTARCTKCKTIRYANSF